MSRKHSWYKELFIFINRNVIICILLLISIFVIAKYSFVPVPNWVPVSIQNILARPLEGSITFEWFAIFNNLSLAYIASIITYIVVQYIPERRKTNRAFSLLKDEISELYSNMSRVIRMYLFEININKAEESITLEDIKDICNVEITDVTKNCKIKSMKNGSYINCVSYGYNLFSDTKKYMTSIQKAMQNIKGSIYSSHLDSVLIEAISTIENNWFYSCLKEKKTPDTKTPGYKSTIFEFDKGFYEFINCHISLSKYDFDLNSYEFEAISDAEMQSEIEKKQFSINRAIIKYIGTDMASRASQYITALEPTEERLRKSNGVILEILVCYDAEPIKSPVLLQAAWDLAEYVRKNEKESIPLLYDILNSMQIKKRQDNLSSDDKQELKKIIEDVNIPNDVRLGAAIIIGEYKTANYIFEQLSEEMKYIFIQFPIYHLWVNPPVPASSDPQLFTVF